MSLSEPFIRRPVATTLLTAGIALAGITAFGVLPVAPLPNVDSPAISVSAQLPGASPEIMASSVATPLERHLGAIADVTDMTSNERCRHDERAADVRAEPRHRRRGARRAGRDRRRARGPAVRDDAQSELPQAQHREPAHPFARADFARADARADLRRGRRRRVAETVATAEAWAPSRSTAAHCRPCASR